MDYNLLLKVAGNSAEKAARLLRNNFLKPLSYKTKSNRQLVTDLDLKAEKIIIKDIKKAFPDHSILSEETPQLKKSDYKWIIDPIDGTHNLLKGVRIFGISIALEYRGKIILGLINIPLEGKTYSACKNKGAFCNGKRIRVSERKMKDATIIYDSSVYKNREDMLKLLDKVAQKAFNIRMFGSTVESLAWVAAGHLEAEIEFSDRPWDFAAGALIVEEAGGVVTDFKGRPWNPYIPNYVASNKKVHKVLLDLIRKSNLKVLRVKS